jgi:DNA repair protein RadC
VEKGPGFCLQKGGTRDARWNAMVATFTPGPRERLANTGIDVLGDVDLVALLLGTGHATESVSVLAQRLLEEHGGLAGLARAGVGELSVRRGVGAAKGARIAAAIELGRRVVSSRKETLDVRLPDARAVFVWAESRLGSLDHEELWVLALDGQNRLRAARRVASGGLHGMFVAPRDPLRAALREGASGLVLVHNHPSGDPTPSTEDIRFTSAVAEAAQVVATPLLDHVVVAGPKFVSMLERDLLPQRTE